MDSRAVMGGRYELGPALGSGGFGTVYRARDPKTGAEVAIKIVPRGFGADHIARRLRREALALRRIASSHVARILDFGEDEGAVCLVTELVAPSIPLSAEALGRPLLPHEALRAARALLDGLAAAHGAGVAHGDVKPANVLVPRGELESLKIIDFGLARVTTRASLAADAGDDLPRDGMVFGTPRWMAPEVLRGGEIDARSDLYSAGLVLFELLGCGPLFPGDSAKAQLRARLVADPILDVVPAPISIVLARLLARDPARRYRDAREAHTTVCDLDTAPVSIISSGRIITTSSPPSSSMRPHSSTRPTSERAYRLTSLPVDGNEGLRETLRRLDLPMLDALARRERGNLTGRLGRAVALAMRLELDAAALILEPLTAQSDVARAIGATILAPRARRVTRARVDADREDAWVETVPAELAALLAALSAAIGRRDAAQRDVERSTRVLARLERTTSTPAVESTRATLRIAVAAARVRSGELQPGAALDLVTPLLPETRDLAALERVVRALASAEIAARLDETRAREDLERAARIAADSGTTLLDACAATALGSLIVSSATRLEQGLAVLERAGTLLAHGDAPSLEHEAEHHRAAALVVLGRWSDAVGHLRAAREAAHAERALDLEVLSASIEVVAHLALGQRSEAREAAATLGDARIGGAKGRAAALAWVARSLEAMASGELDPAEDALTEAEARVRESGQDAPDAHVLVEVLGMLFDAARGALPDIEGPAAGLERFAQERGFTAFYWFDVLRAVIVRVDDPEALRKMDDALTRLTARLGPQSRLARERKTSAPPSAVRD